MIDPPLRDRPRRCLAPFRAVSTRYGSPRLANCDLNKNFIRPEIDWLVYWRIDAILSTNLVVTREMSGSDLGSLIDRIQRLEDQRSALNGDIKDLFAMAKAFGFDTKVMRQAIRLRRRELAERGSQRDVLDSYNEAVGVGFHESWF